MILDLSSVYANRNTEEEREVRIDMESFRSKMGAFPIIKKEPFLLRVANVDDQRLLIRGALDLTVSIPCDRCLQEVPVVLHLVIDKDLPLEPDVCGFDEKSHPTDPQDEEDCLEQAAYRNGSQLDTDRLVYGEILSVWPLKTLCREDCRGICSKCGANRNETECGCDRSVPDPRMAAFQDVFNKFKEV
ncbi:MAG: DUF177 domain-containing protein [Eubacterium sp.]|nr:DUF177 domain-containing protein [Eubacterium sp.]